MSAAEDTPPAHHEDRGDAKKFQTTVIAIGGLLATAVGVMGRDNLAVAIGFVVVVALGVLLALFFDQQSRETKRISAQQMGEISRWRGHHEKCREDVHSRDILLAMFCVHLGHSTVRPHGERRKPTKFPSELEVAFSRTVGDDASSILEQARRLLQAK